MAREKIKHPPYLTPQEVCYYQQVVESLAKEGISEAYLRQEYRDYAPDKPLGRAICESYSIQELAAILTERAKELGRTPTQQDIFPLYRAYLKRRFGTWPAALRAAGLRYGMEKQSVTADWMAVLIQQPEAGWALLALSERWVTCGVPPLRREIPEAELLRTHFGAWNQVLMAAKTLDQWLEAHPLHTEPPEPEQIKELEGLAGRLGRTPLREEVPEPLRLKLRTGWRSWGSILEAAGLTPLSGDEEARAKWEYQQRICAGSCLLTLIQAPTAKQSKLLVRLEEICRGLGRSPLRAELSPSLRTELSENFGSLRNALFQLGRAPITGSEAQRLRIKLKKSGGNKASPA